MEKTIVMVRRMSRMFKLWQAKRVKTVNPIHGCNYECYHGECWASQMAKRHQSAGVKGYENGFKPAFCPRFLKKKFKAGEVVFVGSMGDLSCFNRVERYRVYTELIESNPRTTFLLETKNPSIFYVDRDILPKNVILSTTIETNFDYGLSKAPKPVIRYATFMMTEGFDKHVSIEPIMFFSHDHMIEMMVNLNPKAISVGYDSLHLSLPEPKLSMTERLADELESRGFYVERKLFRKAWWEK